MPRYRYTGEQTAIALPPTVEGGESEVVQLTPYIEVELPSEMPYVQRLIYKGLLEEVSEPKAKRTKEKEGTNG